MYSLSIIQKEELPQLKKLYEAEKPLHSVTTVAVGHFIERFKKKPEWEKIVTFWSVNDDWRNTGAFAMVNTNDNHILFNTLESSPYSSLYKLLQLLNYDKPMVFICFRDKFRPVVLDVVRVRNLDITFDSGTRNIYFELPDFDISIHDLAPDGYYVDSLNQSHVERINRTWKHRYSHSSDYLSNCIAENPSTGIFHKETGELVAWAVMVETGTMGNLQVDERYHRNGLGELCTATQAFKICKNLGYDFTFHIAHQNKASFQMMTKYGGQWIDNNSWIGISPKEPPKVVHLWGHL